MKIIPISIIFFSCFIYGAQYECVSLGASCTTAISLRDYGLRNAAYPLDWNVTSYQALCEVLERDFDGYLDDVSPNPTSEGFDWGFVNKYGIVHLHDIPPTDFVGDFTVEGPMHLGPLRPDWKKYLPEVQKKYNRRIQRFRNLCNINKKVYFMRHENLSKQQACTLRDIIQKTYPKLDFTLIIIANIPSYATQWGEKNIRSYYIQPTNAWNDPIMWEPMFKDLNLLSNTKPIIHRTYYYDIFH
jgi:hypothetical protein